MTMTQDATSTFGALLKRYRLAAGLSQEALAEAAGLSARAIRALERGERTLPYRETVALLATALKLTPSERTQLEAAGRPRSSAHVSPADRSSTSPPLPAALTSFVGREQEIDDLCALLAQPAVRLVTLTGPGGVGKTRLALRVADELANDYADGVWLVELAALSDPAFVPGRVAAVLGVRQALDRSLLEQLAIVFRPKRLLLVLDNCEHLADACARLLDPLLRACPHLQVLATGRQALGVDGEVNHRVQPLGVPPFDPLPPVEELQRYDAVRLFLERARLVQPGFALTVRNAMAVAEICRRLDGIPLALELAAGRLQALGVEEVALRLDQRFGLLTGGSRVASPRQQTLRATLDWSYDLLGERERTLFQRLSVFAGTFALEAVEAVCSNDGIEQDAVLELLTRLVAQSLVVLEAQPDGTARYRLLETVRQYGRQRLGEKADAIAARHAMHYARVAADAQRRNIQRSGGPRWYRAPWLAIARQLEPEHDNLRRALEWLVERQAIEEIVPTLAALTGTWSHRGMGREGLCYCRTILTMPAMASYTRDRAAVLWLAGHLAYVTGAFAEVRAFREEQVARLRAQGDTLDLAELLGELSLIVREQGDLAAAQALIEEGLLMCRRLGEERIPVGMFIWLGEIYHARGELANARRLYEEGLRAGDLQQGKFPIARVLHHLGAVALDQGDNATARDRFRESLVIHRHQDDRRWFQYALADFAELAAAEGQAERALRLGAAVTIWEAHGYSIQPSERRRFERWMETARGALTSEAAAAVWAEGEAMSIDEALAFALGDDG